MFKVIVGCAAGILLLTGCEQTSDKEETDAVPFESRYEPLPSGTTLISGTSGKDKVAAAASGALDVFPEGLKFTVHDVLADGDGVAVEAESHGDHVSGKSYNNQYHFKFRFRDGKLVELKEYMDTEHVTDVLCGGQRPPFGG